MTLQSPCSDSQITDMQNMKPLIKEIQGFEQICSTKRSKVFRQRHNAALCAEIAFSHMSIIMGKIQMRALKAQHVKVRKQKNLISILDIKNALLRPKALQCKRHW